MAGNDPETTAAARPHLSWVLGLTSTAYFMVVLDSVVVITALPRLQRDLHASVASLQWTLTAFNIAFAAGIITAAAAGDRFGRRRIFTIGLALFTAASAVCALAPNSWPCWQATGYAHQDGRQASPIGVLEHVLDCLSQPAGRVARLERVPTAHNG